MSLTHVDVTLAEHANRFAVHHDGWEDAARAWAASSELVFLAGIVGLLVVAVLLKRRALAGTAALAIAASGVALAIGSAISAIVDRPRPFVAHPQIHPFLSHAADASFPSDHTTAAFAIAVVLVLRLGRIGLPVLVAAATLAVSRVVIGLHYPGDVVAGAAIGTAAAIAVCFIAQRPRTLVLVDRLVPRWLLPAG